MTLSYSPLCVIDIGEQVRAECVCKIDIYNLMLNSHLTSITWPSQHHMTIPESHDLTSMTLPESHDLSSGTWSHQCYMILMVLPASPPLPPGSSSPCGGVAWGRGCSVTWSYLYLMFPSTALASPTKLRRLKITWNSATNTSTFRALIDNRVYGSPAHTWLDSWGCGWRRDWGTSSPVIERNKESVTNIVIEQTVSFSFFCMIVARLVPSPFPRPWW